MLWVLGAPPVGVNVTSKATFALPLALSFCFAPELGFTWRVTSPAAG